MDINRMLNSKEGKTLISILLGLGLACLFRQAIKSENNLIFNGPILDEVEGKIFKQGSKCYKYEIKNDKFNDTKKVVEITKKDD